MYLTQLQASILPMALIKLNIFNFTPNKWRQNTFFSPDRLNTFKDKSSEVVYDMNSFRK